MVISYNDGFVCVFGLQMCLSYRVFIWSEHVNSEVNSEEWFHLFIYGIIWKEVNIYSIYQNPKNC